MSIKRWEYQILYGMNPTPDCVELMNSIGDVGWELVSHQDGMLIFKRPKSMKALEPLWKLINEERLDLALELCERLMMEVGADDPDWIYAETVIKNRMWEKENEL